MKSIILAFALIAIVSSVAARKRDVSHLAAAQGWSKDANGYNYPQPNAKFDVSEEPAVEEIQTFDEITEEPYTVDVPVEVEEVVEDELVVADPVIEITNDYLPPVSNEYLPPQENAIRKRQAQLRKVQAKRQVPVKRVYRRVANRRL